MKPKKKLLILIAVFLLIYLAAVVFNSTQHGSDFMFYYVQPTKAFFEIIIPFSVIVLLLPTELARFWFWFAVIAVPLAMASMVTSDHECGFMCIGEIGEARILAGFYVAISILILLIKGIILLIDRHRMKKQQMNN